MIQVVDTREEADAWLLIQAEEDFENNEDPPTLFTSREAAEAALEEREEYECH